MSITLESEICYHYSGRMDIAYGMCSAKDAQKESTGGPATSVDEHTLRCSSERQNQLCIRVLCTIIWISLWSFPLLYIVFQSIRSLFCQYKSHSIHSVFKLTVGSFLLFKIAWKNTRVPTKCSDVFSILISPPAQKANKSEYRFKIV